MGSIWFPPGILANRLSETAGYKAGLTLSVEELCDHLAGTKYPDMIRDSENHLLRVRSEDFEGLFYKLLHRIGYLPEEYDGGHVVTKSLFEYERQGLLREYEGVLRIFGELSLDLMRSSLADGARSVDPTSILRKCHEQYGEIGLQMALRQIEALNQSLSLNPHTASRAHEWSAPLELRQLFAGTTENPEHGRFIDQRFIDYLSRNQGKLPVIHWRKLEELAAEFFHREGYEVAIGPGSNDDGVDVRVWRPGGAPTDNPLCLVQCKRQKDKIERVTVKGLYADVTHEGAEFGVIVTTSELSPAARQTISARGYPIQEVERHALGEWLSKLRRPGTGIVRF